MKSIFTISVLFLVFTISTSVTFAGEHALAAHEHGSIKVGMAIEKNIVEIDIDGPAESFLGFEYIPKSAREKKLLSDLEIKWTKNLESMIAFDKKLNCKVSEASFKQIIDEAETKEAQAKIKDSNKKEAGVHSDIEAKARLVCTANLNGSNVTISLKKVFKNMKKLSIDILGTETKSVEITTSVQTIKI
ncbi:MAG: DUF2796 domain-containing protein [Bacteriovorax sp.]|nr:DUF2796 domain-containing protein [Bacteriovorax sp.]